MAEKLEIRLTRLAAAERRSKETHTDDVSALHDAIREAESVPKSVRWIADRIGRSVSHTHRIMSGLTGPGRS
jgi:predicted transcriptional regulator